MARAESRQRVLTSPLRVGILSSADPASRRPLSGTLYYMCRAIEAHCGPVTPLGPTIPLAAQLGRTRNRLSVVLRGKRWPFEHTSTLASAYARAFSRKLSECPPCDVLFAPFASTEIAALKTPTPIVYASDSTFARMLDYYPGFSGLSSSYAKNGDQIERAALGNARLVTYPSDWAAHSAVTHYGVDPSRISVIPWGANLDFDPWLLRPSHPRRTVPMSLLFLATDWARKGGAIAFEAVSRLRDTGLDVELTVCGTRAPSAFRAPWMHIVPPLDKNDLQQQRDLARLLLEATVLFVPTRNECFGHVFVEASACGTPTIATDTGGVSAIVQEGVNGHLLPLEAPAEAYATLLRNLLTDGPRLANLSATSRKRYELTLTWERWGGRMRELFDRAARQPRADVSPGGR